MISHTVSTLVHSQNNTIHLGLPIENGTMAMPRVRPWEREFAQLTGVKRPRGGMFGAHCCAADG